MNKIRSFFLIGLCAWTLVSCNSDKAQIKTVITSFFTALNHKDPQSAKLYATKASADVLNMIQQQMLTSEDSSQNTNEKFLISDIQIKGDIATASVRSETQQHPLTVTVKKEGKDWKVAFDKSGIMDMMGGEDSLHLPEEDNQTPTAPGQTLQLSDSGVTPTRKDTQVLELPH
ncbi:MAG: hypothetical protein QM610_04185 [Chitinophagaceae bacterium]